jgi:hypothetical protein
MTEFEAITAVYGVVQPLLIQAVAGKASGWKKWSMILLLSIAGGVVIHVSQHGGTIDATTYRGLFTTFIQILAYSLGAWGGLWRKIFPDKHNPLKPRVGKFAYEIKMELDGVEYHGTASGNTLTDAVRQFIEKSVTT